MVPKGENARAGPKTHTPSQFEFVHVTRPEDAATKETRRRVRSNAARNPAGRRQRMIRYQSERSSSQDQGSGPKQSTVAQKGGGTAISHTPDVCLAWPIPNPMEILRAARRDPFNCAARSVTPFESFLLDHCICLFPSQPSNRPN
jgi:hypothetical protein